MLPFTVLLGFLMDSELLALSASEIFIIGRRGVFNEKVKTAIKCHLRQEAPISHISASLEVSCLGRYSFKTFPLATQQALLGVNLGNILLEAKVFLVLLSQIIYLHSTDIFWRQYFNPELCP